MTNDQVRVRLLFVDRGSYHDETVEIPAAFLFGGVWQAVPIDGQEDQHTELTAGLLYQGNAPGCLRLSRITRPAQSFQTCGM